jgi:LysM repeat protein
MKYRPAGQGIAGSLGRYLLVGVVSLLLVLGTVVGAGIAFADTTYRVQPGDTLIGIAARYDTTVDAIVAANSLPNRSTIYAGQTLTIPTGSPKPPAGNANQASGTYVVQSGDSLSAIAVRYGTTVDALMRANGLPNTTIYAGQVLKIVPASYAPPTQQPQSTQTTQLQPSQQPQDRPGTYVVQPGDSFSRIAAKYGITAQALAAANGLSMASLIYKGQILTIPAPGQQPQATAIAPTSVPPTTPPTPAAPTPVPITAVPATQMPKAGTTTTPLPAGSPTEVEPGKPIKYTVQVGDTLTSIAARFSTTVVAIMQLNGMTDPNFLYAGQVLTIIKGDDQGSGGPQPGGTAEATTPIPTPTPPMGKFGPKWVDVNLTTQTMVAYEGQTPVYSSRVSSGVYNHPTVLGTYRIYAKYTSTKMTGGTQGIDYYNIPNVPYTMYFYSGYALHGAFWHNNFGNPMSHGCVNLPVDVSKWMFDWAPIGTMVVTHK